MEYLQPKHGRPGDFAIGRLERREGVMASGAEC